MPYFSCVVFRTVKKNSNCQAGSICREKKNQLLKSRCSMGTCVYTFVKQLGEGGGDTGLVIVPDL